MPQAFTTWATFWPAGACRAPNATQNQSVRFIKASSLTLAGRFLPRALAVKRAADWRSLDVFDSVYSDTERLDQWAYGGAPLTNGLSGVGTLWT